MHATRPSEQTREAGAARRYDHAAVEERWQATWREDGAHATPPADQNGTAFVSAGCPVPVGDVGLAGLRGFAVADAYARFQRARGRSVLFSLGFDCFDELVEQEAARQRVSPAELARTGSAAVRRQFERLGYSVDWDRAFRSSDPDHCLWSQRLFLLLLEQGAIYRSGDRWLLRASAYAEENEHGLDTLPGWSDEAARLQRAALGRAEGIEIDAVVVGGGKLPVFTPDADSVELAAFVAVSPGHAEIGAFTALPEVVARFEEAQRADWWRDGNGGRRVPAVATGLQASVPGAASLLPIVVSPLFDGRFGEAAVLGIPERDEGARLIAERLERPAGLWKLAKSGNSEPRPAVRYRARDARITRTGTWGVPVPLVICASCGTQPVPLDRLPVTGSDDAGCECPRCGGPAQRDASTIDPGFDRTWMWMSVCVPVDERAASLLGHASHGRWLPAWQVVAAADAGGYLLDQRTVAKVLQEAERLPAEAREPSAGAVVCGSLGVDADDVSDPAELIADVGADVVRLALLNAATPARSFAWNDQPVRRCQRFLAELWDYAEPRLGEGGARDAGIDRSTRSRRQLDKWCRVGADKVTASLERLETQRATHNAILLLTRIEDFESRAAAEADGLDERDREAVVAALLTLLKVLAPFAPHIAEELWSIAGRDTPLADAPWPKAS